MIAFAVVVSCVSMAGVAASLVTLAVSEARAERVALPNQQNRSQ